jgi:hypothetical protein
MEGLVTVTVRTCAAIACFVIGAPLAAATEADVQKCLRVIETYETRGNCTFPSAEC